MKVKRLSVDTFTVELDDNEFSTVRNEANKLDVSPEVVMKVLIEDGLNELSATNK